MNVSYLQQGEGEDLLFLHGYLANKESFYPQISYFSKFYRVTALDFPGMGQAEPIPFPWSVADYAEWVKGALKELNISRPRVIAHSFGGRVAVKLLSENFFPCAVLTGCAGIVKKRNLCYRFRVRSYKICKKIAPKFAEKHFGSEEYRTLSPVMRESYKKIVNEDLRETAASISAPVLFLHGERDEEVPLSSIRIYLEKIEGSRLKILKNCGHFPFLDDPLAFNLAAEEFLRCQTQSNS